MAKASIAAGADGLLMEVHFRPEEALCDGSQSLFPEEFGIMMEDLKKVAHAVGRSIHVL
jgi:3-deoxy-7-phosphoheptulonate synthase